MLPDLKMEKSLKFLQKLLKRNEKSPNTRKHDVQYRILRGHYFKNGDARHPQASLGVRSVFTENSNKVKDS